jgi:competence protein ComEA
MRRVRAQVFWWLAGAILVVLAAVRLLGGGSEQQAAAPVRVVGERHAAAPRGASPSGATSAGLYVHVAGRVRRPGLYRLGDGARVAAAIDRAGGPARRADLARVNLAARIEDGQQILVPRIGAGQASAGQAGAAAGGSGGVSGAAGEAGAKLSLAGATAEQLDGLDGIGPTLAKRILQYRDAHGGFRSVGQLRDVEGIGAKRFEALSKAVGP